MLSWAERLQLSSGGCYFGSTGWRREPRGSGVVQLQAWLCSPVFAIAVATAVEPKRRMS